MPVDAFSDARKRINACLKRGDFETAEQLAEELCQQTDRLSDWFALGQIRLRAGDLAAALTTFNHIDTREPGHAEVNLAAAYALSQTQRHEEAYQRLQAQLALTPEHVETLVQAGTTAEALGKPAQAQQHYDAALALKPDHYSALLNRAAIRMDQGQFDAALTDYLSLCKHYSERADLWHAQAECLRKLDRMDEAVDTADHALSLNPALTAASLCKASALACRGEIDAAQVEFARCWQHDAPACRNYGSTPGVLLEAPDARTIELLYLYSRQTVADWSRQRRWQVRFEHYFASPTPPADIALAFPALFANLSTTARIALYCAISADISQTTQTSELHREWGHKRIRIGYLSSKFGAVTTMAMTAGVYRAHNRKRFEVFAYALNADDNSAERQQLINDVDHLVELHALNDKQANQRIRDDKIDILIDLNGFSDGARPHILAQRAAPLQVCFLGHQHSLFAPWIDYRITDHIAEPRAIAEACPESLVYFASSPFCYDTRRQPYQRMNKEAAGLPEAATVLCGFNGIERIDSHQFSAWMKILSANEAFVLWLLDPGEAAQSRLLDAAQKHEINTERLIFAPRIGQRAHLRRLSAADLFLDTFNCSAHTGALDAIHAGVPILTRCGDTQAQRVGAALNAALQMPEVLTQSDINAYVATAIELGSSAARLSSLRVQLSKTLSRHNPFASEFACRRLEHAFDAMLSHQQNGTRPCAINID